MIEELSESFVSLVLSDKIEDPEAEIYKYINSAPETVDKWSWLGLSREEYLLWLHRPHLLNDILAVRRITTVPLVDPVPPTLGRFVDMSVICYASSSVKA